MGCGSDDHETRMKGIGGCGKLRITIKKLMSGSILLDNIGRYNNREKAWESMCGDGDWW